MSYMTGRWCSTFVISTQIILWHDAWRMGKLSVSDGHVQFSFIYTEKEKGGMLE